MTQSTPAPYFSVLIPTYNRAHLLRRSVGSVLTQAFRDYEVVVVDDGSTDDTPTITGELAADPRVVVVRHEHNRGVGAAWPTGIAAATGSVVVFLGSDDELLPGALSVLYDAWEAAAGAQVGMILFRIVDAKSGKLLSRLDVPDGTDLRYEDLICQDRVAGDFASSFRREALADEPWPAASGYEGLVMWRIRRTWISRYFQDPLIAVHFDSPDRLTRINARRRNAQDLAQAAATDLAENGPALLERCPERYQRLAFAAAFYFGLAGHRRLALRAWAKGLRPAAVSPTVLVLPLLVLLGPWALSSAYRLAAAPEFS